MIVIMAILLTALSAVIILTLGRWAARPMFYDLTRFQGPEDARNAAALDAWRYRYQKVPYDIRVPSDVGDAQRKHWPLLTWDGDPTT